jgi:hypothetical protein
MFRILLFIKKFINFNLNVIPLVVDFKNNFHNSFQLFIPDSEKVELILIHTQKVGQK